MLIAVFVFFTMLALLDRYTRQSRVDHLVLETRYKLFRLRDFLRSSAISGDIDAESWLFDFLDTSLTRSAAWLPNLSVYELLGDFARNDKTEAARLVAVLRQELDKPENHRFLAVFKGYDTCLREFLKKRHRAITISGGLVFSICEGFGSTCNRRQIKEHASDVLATDPDTSTLKEYCHQC
jgi:hypothetical protein